MDDPQLRTFEKFVPLSTNGNEVMVYANCDEAYNGQFVGYWDFQCQQRVREAEFGDPPGDESQKALYWRALGFDYARDHIGELPKIVALRVLRQWELFRPRQNVDFSAIEGRDKDSAALGLGMFYGLAGRRDRRCGHAAPSPGAAAAARRPVRQRHHHRRVHVRHGAVPRARRTGAVRARGVAAVPLLARAWRWTMPPDVRRRRDPGRGPRRRSCSAVPVRCARRAEAHAATGCGIGIVGLAVALPLRGLYHTTGGTMEEGFMLDFPERMLKGDVPNVDFLHLYGPGALHVLMGWYKVFGSTLGAERTFGLLQHLAIIFALFALARAWGRAAATAVAALSTC